jgi:hypothetical protein
LDMRAARKSSLLADQPNDMHVSKGA